MKHQIFFTPKLTTLGSWIFIIGLGIGVTAVLTKSNENLYKQRPILTGSQSLSIHTGISQISKIEKSLKKPVKNPEHLKISKQEFTVVAIESNSNTDNDDDQYEQDLAYEEQMVELQIQTEQRINHMDNVLKNEVRDINWEYAVQEGFYEKLQHEEMSSLELLDTECGATMCRLTLSGDTSDEGDGSITTLDLSQLWHGAGFFSLDEGTGQLLLYIAREDYTLPNTSDI